VKQQARDIRKTFIVEHIERSLFLPGSGSTAARLTVVMVAPVKNFSICRDEDI
jgi:hypothetical protein